MNESLRQKIKSDSDKFEEERDHQEESYRRGYTHGVLAAQNGITLKEAYAWRHTGTSKNPPGTPGFEIGYFEET